MNTHDIFLFFYIYGPLCEIYAVSTVCTFLSSMCETYPSHISRSELYGAKKAQDDDDDVEEIGQNGSPLVAEEIDHLPLQHGDLREKRRVTITI